MDPWDSLGSLSQPLGDAGSVMALACHPSRPVVAACLSNGTIGLWDYQGADGAGSGGGGGGGDPGLMGSGDGYVGGGPGGGSAPSSPVRSRGGGKAGKDEK